MAATVAGMLLLNSLNPSSPSPSWHHHRPPLGAASLSIPSLPPRSAQERACHSWPTASIAGAHATAAPAFPGVRGSPGWMRAPFPSSPVVEARQMVAGATGKPRRSPLLPRPRVGKSRKKTTTQPPGPTFQRAPHISVPARRPRYADVDKWRRNPRDYGFSFPKAYFYVSLD
ncbi:hypothetical protein VPH35_012734 [Triticum aestivum]